MSTISGIAGNTSCASKRRCRGKGASATPSASPANVPAHPRIVVACGDMLIFWKRFTIQSTLSMTRCWNGWGASSIRMPLIWRRSTRNYKASHNLKRGYGNENFAEHRSQDAQLYVEHLCQIDAEVARANQLIQA